ncbi:MAG: metallophosphoesterase family protein [Pseudomonadota bacterium]
MLNRFFKLSRLLSEKDANTNTETQKARVPEGLRLYAIGDIHGRSDLLHQILHGIERFEASKSDGKKYRLIFLGDYVDRGPDSKSVLDLLTKLSHSTTDTVFLKGNHEAGMLEFIKSAHESDRWLEWGGIETLESYGVDAGLTRSQDSMASDLAKAIPQSHLSFLEQLLLSYEAGDYYFAHAGVKPGTPLKEQSERDLLWIRDEFHNTAPDQRPEKIVVHGHHPVKKPLDAGWRIAVDTGAIWTGKLSAVRLEGSKREFITVHE